MLTNAFLLITMVERVDSKGKEWLIMSIDRPGAKIGQVLLNNWGQVDEYWVGGGGSIFHRILI
jgi:hypothetical protein